MAGRDKRRRAAPLEGDEQQLRRSQEEAALLLRRIKASGADARLGHGAGLVRWVVEEVTAGRSPSIVLHRYRNYFSSTDSASPFPWFGFRPAPETISFLTITSLEQCSPKCVTSLAARSCAPEGAARGAAAPAVEQALLQEGHLLHVPSIFVEVAVVDRAINDICILFKCSRHNLNVVGSCSERV
ncbi:unnamed protein product [Miscanthus lutarioriparius]|uniref:Uncharacterized protein n=1 Tax=Miscanthus lutarioriparius TaxID=422564 RepID=A0A811MI00_9POAL|nr:unnamed protein product [Miscanthus lutarioriparius]